MSVATRLRYGLARMLVKSATIGFIPEFVRQSWLPITFDRLTNDGFVNNAAVWQSKRLEEITAELSEVAEGINTARAVKKLADKAGLEMPIVNEVNAVLYEEKPARDAVSELMSRPLREEVH